MIDTNIEENFGLYSIYKDLKYVVIIDKKYNLWLYTTL